MTLKKLQEHKSVCRQIDLFESDMGVGLKGVDTTKEIVQNSKISKPTEDAGILLAQSAVYDELIRKKNEVLKFVVHINDDTIREIVLHYISGKKFAEIGRIMNYDESTVRKKLHKYLRQSEKL